MPLPARVFFGLPSPRVVVRGVDIAGTVESVGRNVTRFKPGDAVFGVAPGAFAEYASTKEGCLAAKSPRLTFQRAAAVPVAGVTANMASGRWHHRSAISTQAMSGSSRSSF
jgi:NADPH:quinone reductase-like Zn-dependent oxidoreductase